MEGPVKCEHCSNITLYKGIVCSTNYLWTRFCTECKMSGFKFGNGEAEYKTDEVPDNVLKLLSVKKDSLVLWSVARDQGDMKQQFTEFVKACYQYNLDIGNQICNIPGYRNYFIAPDNELSEHCKTHNVMSLDQTLSEKNAIMELLEATFDSVNK